MSILARTVRVIRLLAKNLQAFTTRFARKRTACSAKGELFLILPAIHAIHVCSSATMPSEDWFLHTHTHTQLVGEQTHM